MANSVWVRGKVVYISYWLTPHSPDQTRVGRLWNKNKQCLPNQPSAAHMSLSNTFCKLMMSKDCDILHPGGKPTGYHQYVGLCHNQAWCTDREPSFALFKLWLFIIIIIHKVSFENSYCPQHFKNILKSVFIKNQMKTTLNKVLFVQRCFSKNTGELKIFIILSTQ